MDWCSIPGLIQKQVIIANPPRGDFSFGVNKQQKDWKQALTQ